MRTKIGKKFLYMYAYRTSNGLTNMWWKEFFLKFSKIWNFNFYHVLVTAVRSFYCPEFLLWLARCSGYSEDGKRREGIVAVYYMAWNDKSDTILCQLDVDISPGYSSKNINNWNSCKKVYDLGHLVRKIHHRFITP